MFLCTSVCSKWASFPIEGCSTKSSYVRNIVPGSDLRGVRIPPKTSTCISCLSPQSVHRTPLDTLKTRTSRGSKICVPKVFPSSRRHSGQQLRRRDFGSYEYMEEAIMVSLEMHSVHKQSDFELKVKLAVKQLRCSDPFGKN